MIMLYLHDATDGCSRSTKYYQQSNIEGISTNNKNIKEAQIKVKTVTHA